MDDETESRMQMQKNIIFTGFKENCFFRSDKLDTIKARDEKARIQQKKTAKLTELQGSLNINDLL